MDLANLIATKRPELKPNSINNYVIIINKILGKGFKTLRPLYNHDKIMEWLDKNVSQITQKNYVSAITVSLDALPRHNKKIKDSITFYRSVILAREKARKQFIDTHEKTEKQKNGWCSLDDLKKKSDDLLEVVMPLLDKETLSKNETCSIQNYVISLFYTNPPILPRLEIANLEIVPEYLPLYDEEKRNYIYIDGDDMVMIINQYKTDKKFGRRECKLPKVMVDGINMLIQKIGPDDKNEPFRLFPKLTQNMLGKRISLIFSDGDRKTSLNTIRHIIISNSVDLAKHHQLQELAKNSGHSRSQQIEYAKHLN